MIKDEAEKENNPHSLLAKPGWFEITVPEFYGRGTNFLHGGSNSRRLKIQYFKNEIHDTFMAKVWFGPAPGHAHGGSIAAVPDEAMGLTVWLKGFRAVSARMEMDYIE